MYIIISTIEKLFKGLYIIIKISYYKLKYGSRLKLGRGIRFRKGFIINISKDGYLEIGDGNFFNNYCSINCHKKIKIGNNNMFGESVKIYDHDHAFNQEVDNMRNSYKTGQIYILDNNWICSNVIILRKTIIGSNNVIGAGAIINRRIGSSTIVKVNLAQEEEKIRRKP